MVLLFFMDGLNIEKAKEHMPTLSGMQKAPLMSDFGYSCACHATMYTGKNIDQHNTWFVWKKGDNSPYKFVDRIPLLKHMNCIPVKVLVSKVARKLHKNRSFSGIPMLVNLPLRYWSLFEPSEDRFWSDDDYKPGVPTLFKILKQEKVNHRIVGLSRGGDVFAEEKNVDYQADEFVYYFIGEVDSYLHKYGGDAPETLAYLKQVDNFIKTCCEKARRAQDDVTAICFSDHGHIDVKQKIDINTYFKPFGRNINQYIHLVESTFVRFWFRNKQERAEVEEVLKTLERDHLGFVLDEEIRRTYHLNFDTNEHGDLIFHLRAPNIFTNTIWGFGKTIRSMHGYEPTLPEHYGIFASNKPLVECEFAYLTDVLPTVLHAAGLDETPYQFYGKNLLKG